MIDGIGLIYEAVLTDGTNVGSIAGGGRYDDLVGMYGKRPVPCVGFSIGIERIFTILEENARKKGTIRESSTRSPPPSHCHTPLSNDPSLPDVMVVSTGKDMNIHRMKLVNELWGAGINSEVLFKNDPKPKPQLDYANEKGIPFVCFLGGDEIKDEVVGVCLILLKHDCCVECALFFDR